MRIEDQWPEQVAAPERDREIPLLERLGLVESEMQADCAMAFDAGEGDAVRSVLYGHMESTAHRLAQELVWNRKVREESEARERDLSDRVRVLERTLRWLIEHDGAGQQDQVREVLAAATVWLDRDVEAWS